MRRKPGGNHMRQRLGFARKRALWLGGAAFVAVLGTGVAIGASPSPYTKEHTITVDPTRLTPPTRWYVPGITPYIRTLDPEVTDAYSTTQQYTVNLKPGRYRFSTFTFDFPFVVTLDGVLDFAQSLDQCVEGRGTQTLKVRCSRTMPYGGQPEY